MYVFMHVCMYVCIYVFFKFLNFFVYMYVCIYTPYMDYILAIPCYAVTIMLLWWKLSGNIACNHIYCKIRVRT
jgi:hypothetical protein